MSKGLFVLLTGLPCSGKTTIARATETAIIKSGLYPQGVSVLDGDEIRRTICADLGFSVEDRAENLRRVAHLGKLLVEQNTIVLASFIAPYESDRREMEQIIGSDNFMTIFVDCPIQVCVNRDVKGMYVKAWKGEISNFTGISAPYEIPKNPNLTIDTSEKSLEECVKWVRQEMFIHENP